MKIKKIIIIIVIILLCGCVKKAKLNDINYNNLISKLDNKDTFILSININDNNEYTKNLNTIIETYNINIINIDVDDLNDKEKKDLKKKLKYENVNTLLFIKDGLEDNPNNRVEEDMNVEQMIEIFKKTSYID